jgi:hypothetical protein
MEGLRRGWRSDHPAARSDRPGRWCLGNPNPRRAVWEELLMGWAKPHTRGGFRFMYLWYNTFANSMKWIAHSCVLICFMQGWNCLLKKLNRMKIISTGLEEDHRFWWTWIELEIIGSVRKFQNMMLFIWSGRPFHAVLGPRSRMAHFFLAQHPNNNYYFHNCSTKKTFNS